MAELQSLEELTGDVKQISLDKGDHRYIFRYSSGCEAEIIAAFSNLASNPDSGFDWYDAAILSYQLGKRMEMDSEGRKV